MSKDVKGGGRFTNANIVKQSSPDIDSKNSSETIRDISKKHSINKLIANKMGRLRSYQYAKRITKKITKFTIRLAKFLVKTIMSLFTPLGIACVLGLIITILIIAGSKVLGPMNMSKYCSDNGAPKLENFLEEDAKSALVGYLSNDNTITKIGAIYLSNMIKHSSDFGKGTNIPIGCSTKCLNEKIENGTFPEDATFGPFKLKGEAAKILIKHSIYNNSEWIESSNQLAAVKITIAKHSDDYSLSDNYKKIQSIVGISAILEHDLTIKESFQEYAKSSKQEKKINTDIAGCITMGKGGNRSRFDGGNARDTGFGQLDMSNMISFLESFCSSTKIVTPGSNGSLFATEEMKEAKRLAEEMGGADPMPLLYSSCDRMVAIALKAMKIDVGVPWGAVEHQKAYFSSKPNEWKKLENNCDRLSGDIMIQDGHIMIYGVNNDNEEMIYQASYLQYLPSKRKIPPCGPTIYGKKVEYWRYIGSGMSEIRRTNE